MRTVYRVSFFNTLEPIGEIDPMIGFTYMGKPCTQEFLLDISHGRMFIRPVEDKWHAHKHDKATRSYQVTATIRLQI